jgi:excisionase family DNA binding protein
VAATLAAADIEALEERVLGSVLERLQSAASPWMNVDQAAEYLAWPKKRLYNLTQKSQVPHRKVENRLLFHREELDQWLAEHYQGPPGYPVD